MTCNMCCTLLRDADKLVPGRFAWVTLRRKVLDRQNSYFLRKRQILLVVLSLDPRTILRLTNRMLTALTHQALISPQSLMSLDSHVISLTKCPGDVQSCGDPVGESFRRVSKFGANDSRPSDRLAFHRKTLDHIVQKRMSDTSLCF